MWALLSLIALIALFIASIIVFAQGNIYALWIALIFGAIIIITIVSLIKEAKYKKSKNQQGKEQIVKQHAIEKQEQCKNRNQGALQSEMKLKVKDYHCSNCSYCETTNDFYTRWCSYWNKMTYLTSGCSRDTTVLDYDYDEDFD